MEPEQFPAVDEALVRSLEAKFPDRLPRRPIGDFDLGRCVGAQDVIAFLRSEMELQESMKRS